MIIGSEGIRDLAQIYHPTQTVSDLHMHITHCAASPRIHHDIFVVTKAATMSGPSPLHKPSLTCRSTYVSGHAMRSYNVESNQHMVFVGPSFNFSDNIVQLKKFAACDMPLEKETQYVTKRRRVPLCISVGGIGSIRSLGVLTHS